MRVLVTGGAGFIGKHLVRALRNNDHEVAILDRVQADYSVHQYGFDIRDRRDTLAAFRDYLPDAVCHLAAQVSVPESFRDPYTDSDINIMGGISVLDAARAVRVKQFVFASSGGAIYGEVPMDPARETDAPQVASPYGASKLAFESIMFSKMRDDMRCTSLRLANVYGPGQRYGVVAEFMRAVSRGEPLRVFGNCERDYIHVNDVVSAFVAAIESRVPWPIMNVATGSGTRTLELAELIGGGIGKGNTLIDGYRYGDVSRSVLSSERLRGCVGEPMLLLFGLMKTRNEWNDDC